MVISVAKKEPDIMFRSARMTEKECDEYLHKVWDSLSEKQKQVADRDIPDGWLAVLNLSDEECERRLKEKEENKTAGMGCLRSQ